MWRSVDAAAREAGCASAARLSKGGQGGLLDAGAAAPDGGLGGAFEAGAIGQVLVCCLGRTDGEAARVGGVQGRLWTKPHLFRFLALSSSLPVYFTSLPVEALEVWIVLAGWMVVDTRRKPRPTMSVLVTATPSGATLLLGGVTLGCPSPVLRVKTHGPFPDRRRQRLCVVTFLEAPSFEQGPSCWWSWCGGGRQLLLLMLTAPWP